jgi:tetratricopeptide (TPR) repeat protein
VRLIEIYTTRNTTSPQLVEFIPDVLLAALIWALWKFRAVFTRGPFFAMAYFIITLLPVLGFLKMSYMRLTLVADHFQYFSDISIIALFAAAVVTLYQRWDAALRPILVGACALLLTAFSAYCWERAGVHQSEETLWRDTLSKNSESWQAHNHMGAVLFTQGHHKEALPHFLAATQLKPKNPESHNNLGLALATQGKMEEAIAQYREAVRIQDNPAMRMNLANALAQVGRFDEAIENYRAALKLDANNVGALCNLGITLARLGRLDEAKVELEKALKIDPRMTPARNNLDLIQRELQRRKSH